MKSSVTLLIMMLGLTTGAFSQISTKSDTGQPDPKVAFFKSMVLPGWGHHYLGRDDWTRGRYHLAADAILILSYLGLRIHSSGLRKNWYTYARSKAGVDIENRDRAFRLAVGDFDNLQDYNDYQADTRRWDRFYEDSPANRWNWGSRDARNRYGQLRNRFETLDRQLPALLSLMVVNRVVSAVSAYNRARKSDDTRPSVDFNVSPRGNNGLVAYLFIPL